MVESVEVDLDDEPQSLSLDSSGSTKLTCQSERVKSHPPGTISDNVLPVLETSSGDTTLGVAAKEKSETDTGKRAVVDSRSVEVENVREKSANESNGNPNCENLLIVLTALLGNKNTSLSDVEKSEICRVLTLVLGVSLIAGSSTRGSLLKHMHVPKLFEIFRKCNVACTSEVSSLIQMVSLLYTGAKHSRKKGNVKTVSKAPRKKYLANEQNVPKSGMGEKLNVKQIVARGTLRSTKSDGIPRTSSRVDRRQSKAKPLPHGLTESRGISRTSYRVDRNHTKAKSIPHRKSVTLSTSVPRNEVGKICKKKYVGLSEKGEEKSPLRSFISPIAGLLPLRLKQKSKISSSNSPGSSKYQKVASIQPQRKEFYPKMQSFSRARGSDIGTKNRQFSTGPQKRESYSKVQNFASPAQSQIGIESRQPSIRPQKKAFYPEVQNFAIPRQTQIGAEHKQSSTQPQKKESYSKMQNSALSRQSLIGIENRQSSTRPQKRESYSKVQNFASPAQSQIGTRNKKASARPQRKEFYPMMQSFPRARELHIGTEDRQSNIRPQKKAFYSEVQNLAMLRQSQIGTKHKKASAQPLKKESYSKMQNSALSRQSLTGIEKRQSRTRPQKRKSYSKVQNYTSSRQSHIGIKEKTIGNALLRKRDVLEPGPFSFGNSESHKAIKENLRISGKQKQSTAQRSFLRPNETVGKSRQILLSRVSGKTDVTSPHRLQIVESNVQKGLSSKSRDPKIDSRKESRRISHKILVQHESLSRNPERRIPVFTNHSTRKCVKRKL